MTHGIKKVYIAGCGGMLGEAVYSHFSKCYEVQATDITPQARWLSHADVCDFNEMRNSIARYNPDAVVNLAAHTDMEFCEQNELEAFNTNALGAENMALISAELDIPYIYISTAGVFNGEKELYSEYDEPSPLSIYAKSKYEGEKLTQLHARKHFIVRAGWMMGGGPKKDKKFINKIYSQVCAGVKTLNIVGDKYGTPTYTKDFAIGLSNMLGSPCYGTYHQTCMGHTSRYDVGVEFVRLLGLAEKIKINKVESSHFQNEYFAPRPKSEILIGEKMKSRGFSVMKDWKTSLAEYSLEFPV